MSSLWGFPSTGTRDVLGRSVLGIAENLAKYGHRAELVVSVDSNKKEMNPLLLKDISDAAEKYGQKLRILDSGDRKSFLDSLPPFIDKESAGWGLLPGPHHHTLPSGAWFNRNILMLAGVGTTLIQTDDDIVCVPAISSNSSIKSISQLKSTGFTNEIQPVPLYFYPNREKLLSEVASADIDISTVYDSLLGQTLSNLVSDAEYPSGMEDWRVLLVCSGCYGDSGMVRARTVLSLRGSSRDWLISNQYSDLRYSRELIRIPEQTLIGPPMFFMAGQSGFDMREFIPPYLPFGVNDDGLFSMLLKMCVRNSVTAYPSFGLFHSPEAQRSLNHSSLTGYMPNRSEMMMSVLFACMPDSSIKDPEKRLLSIASSMQDVGKLDSRELYDVVIEAWTRGAMAYTEVLKELLDEHSRMPEDWARDVEGMIGNVETLVREPITLFGPNGCGFNREQFADGIFRSGLFLELWPDLLSHARNNPL